MKTILPLFNCLLLPALLISTGLIATSVSASNGGIPNYSQNATGSDSCHNCHTQPSNTSTRTLTISGNSTTLTGSINTYTIKLTTTSGSRGAYGGFDLSSTEGTLSPADAETQILNGELVHSSRKATTYTGSSYDVQWSFDWQAPTSVGTTTFYACGLPVNGDGRETRHNKQSDDHTVCTLFSILVQQAPTAISGNNQTVTEGDAVTLDGSASNDADGSISSYLWEQISGIAAIINNANSDIADFTAPAVADNTTDELIFRLTVTDNDGLTDTATISIFDQDVLVSNVAPSANAGTDQTINENTVVSLDATASTDDGSIVTYLWQQTAGFNSVTLSDNASITPSFIAPLVTASGDILTFQLTVTDDLGVQSTDTVNITVNDVDTAPTAVISDASGSIISSIDNNGPVILYGNFSSDPEGPITAYSWVQTAGPAIASPGAANTSSFTFTAPDSPGSTIDIQLTVNGDEGLVQDTTTLTLTLVNQAPEVDTGSDQLVNELATGITLDGNSSVDPNGTISSYLWEQISGTTATINNATLDDADFTAPDVPANTTDELIFQLTVTDNYGLTDVGTVSVFVQDALVTNLLPVADAGSDQIVNESTLVTLDASASTDDGTIVSYLWQQTAGKNTAVLSDNTAIMPTFTAPLVDASNDELYFELTVTDDLGTQSTETVNIVINDVDTPPVAKISDSSGAIITSIDNNRLLTLYGNFSTDAEGPITAYSWSQTAGTAIVNPGITNGSTFTFTAPDDAGTSIDIQLTVTGDEGFVQNSITATLILINQPPVADAGMAQLVVEGNVVSLDGSLSSDVDGTIASYQWQQLSGSATILANANTVNASFSAPDVPANTTDNLTFQLTVTDSYGLTDTSTVTISVEDVLVSNITPTANAGADQVVNENTLVTLDGSGSTDDGLISSYAWTQTSGTSVTLSNANSVTPNFSAPAVSIAGDVLTFQLVVTDNVGVTSIADNMTVTVSNVDNPPIARITDITGTVITAVNNNSLITLYGNFSSDADGPVTAYSWSQTAGAAIVSPGSANTSSFTFTTPDASGSSIDIQLTVTGEAGQVQNSITATLILDNLPPVVDAGTDTTITEGEVIQLNGTVTDPNNDLSSVLWQQINCGSNCIMPPVNIALPLTAGTALTTVLSPSVTEANSGLVLEFELVATDNSGLITTSGKRVAVNDNGISNFPPEAVPFTSFNGLPMAIAVMSVDPANTATISRLETSNNTSINDSTNRPLSFPYELTSLDILLTAPGSVKVTLYFPAPVPEGDDFYQYLGIDSWVNTSKAKNFDDIRFSFANGWQEISEKATFSADRRSVTFLLTDGGPSDENPEPLVISISSGIGQNQLANLDQPGATGMLSPLSLLLFGLLPMLLRLKHQNQAPRTKN